MSDQLQTWRLEPRGSKGNGSMFKLLSADYLFPGADMVFLEDSACDDDVKQLTALNGLVVVDLQGQRVTDKSIEHLIEIETLTKLSLGETSITPQGLAQLEKSRALSEVSLEMCSRTGDYLEVLPKLQSIRVLSVAVANASDEGLISIQKLESLRALRLLSVSGVTPVGVEAATRAEGLVELHLIEMGLDDQVFPDLGSHRQLKYLNVSFNSIGDETVAKLAHLDLVILDLEGTEVTDDCVESLVGMKYLERVVLKNTRLTAKGISRLESLRPDLEVH